MSHSDSLRPDLRALIKNYVVKPTPQSKGAIQEAAGLSPDASIAAVVDEDYQAREMVTTSGLYGENPASVVGEVRDLIPAETSEFTQPFCLTGEAPDALLQHYRRPQHSPAVRLYEIARERNAVSYYRRIPLCLVGDKSIAIIPEISGRNYEAIYFYGGKRSWEQPSIRVEDIIVIHDRFVGINYCHWLLDWFIRAIVLRKLDPPSTAYVALPYPPTRFMKECLSKIGIDESRLLAAKGHLNFDDSTFATKRLWASSSSGTDWRHGLHYGAGWAFRELRRVLYKGETRKRSVILQRRDFRRLVFEDSAFELLMRNGFEVLYAEDLSTEEQVEIFSGANRVIAAHGAGMANIAFCPEGAAILEIFPPMHATPVYWFVSNVAHLHYTCAIGRLSENEKARMPTDHDIFCSKKIVQDWLDILK